MLRNQITGAKYRSENTGQMTNLNIATPADSNDTNFSSSDLLLAKDTAKLIDAKIANKKPFVFVETLPNKIENVDPNVIYVVTGNNAEMQNVEIINQKSIGGGGISPGVNDPNVYNEYIFVKVENKRLYYEQLGTYNQLPLFKGTGVGSITGLQSMASGNYSTAFGCDTVAKNNGECAVGIFNNSTKSDDTSEQTLFSVGNGLQNERNNAFEVKANGDIYILPGSAASENTNPVKLQDVFTLYAKLQNDLYNMFEVVTELPSVEDAESCKIYCIKDPNSTDSENKYIEYVLVKDSNTEYHFEKIGQFNATPDLSGYAKLSGSNFNGHVGLGGGFNTANINTYNGKYLTSAIDADKSANKVFATDGSLADIGTSETFKFTLEDGSIVTKDIRVLSTTKS